MRNQSNPPKILMLLAAPLIVIVIVLVYGAIDTFREQPDHPPRRGSVEREIYDKQQEQMRAEKAALEPLTVECSNEYHSLPGVWVMKDGEVNRLSERLPISQAEIQMQRISMFRIRHFVSYSDEQKEGKLCEHVIQESMINDKKAKDYVYQQALKDIADAEILLQDTRDNLPNAKLRKDDRMVSHLNGKIAEYEKDIEQYKKRMESRIYYAPDVLGALGIHEPNSRLENFINRE